MSGYDFDNFSDGDWEDKGELLWNEYDWQKYLNKSDKETERFLSLYHKLKHQADHLDAIALMMGWDVGEWGMADGAEDTAEEITDEDAEGEEPDPYTVHQHPVYIVTHSLCHQLRLDWEACLAQNSRSLTPQFTWEFARSLQATEMNAVMAIHALDVGDYALAVCQLKNGLSAMNHSMRLVQLLPTQLGSSITTFQQKALAILFDLREVCLRVMHDCRDVYRGGSDD